MIVPGGLSFAGTAAMVGVSVWVARGAAVGLGVWVARGVAVGLGVWVARGVAAVVGLGVAVSTGPVVAPPVACASGAVDDAVDRLASEREETDAGAPAPAQAARMIPARTVIASGTPRESRMSPSYAPLAAARRRGRDPRWDGPSPSS
jgi:hypothetical protein